MSAQPFEHDEHIHTPEEIPLLESSLRERNKEWYAAFNEDPTSLKTQYALHNADQTGDHLAKVHNLFPVEPSRISLSGIKKAIVGRLFGK